MKSHRVWTGISACVALLAIGIFIFAQTAFSQKTSSSISHMPLAMNTSQPAETSTTSTNSSNKERTTTINDDDINRFSNSIVLIKDFYVQPVKDQTLLDNAIRGIVSGLDPHSEYLDKDAYKTLLMSTSGEFGGVGIEVTPEFGILKIVAPMDDTPAAKAGIKSGDYIVAINGHLVSELTLQEAVDTMRGKTGSLVVLTVLRKGEKAPLTFKLTRQIIKISSVKSRMLDNNFGYIRISQFQEPTAKLLTEAILNLKNNNELKGIILDLRNNPGGLLESAVDVTNRFLNSKNLKKYNSYIVYTAGRLPEAQYNAKATGNDLLNGLPIVVLINGGSASASEIVAGALQDYGRALIVGKTSFGKGSVQTVIPLDKTHALKLTTALYHTPSGRVIQNIGIIPDIQLEDLKVEKNKTPEDLSMLEPIKEYQLRNHLPGTGHENTNLLISSDINLADEDFQLFEALKILRTMDKLHYASK